MLLKLSFSKKEQLVHTVYSDHLGFQLSRLSYRLNKPFNIHRLYADDDDDFSGFTRLSMQNPSKLPSDWTESKDTQCQTPYFHTSNLTSDQYMWW